MLEGKVRGWVAYGPHGSDPALAWQTGPLGDVGAQRDEGEKAAASLC